MESRKKILLITIGAIVLLSAISFFAFHAVFEQKQEEGGSGASPPPPQPETRAPVPQDVVVPDTKTASSSVPANVAKPKYVAPAMHGSPVSARGFDVRVEGDKFIPDTVTVKSGDIVTINVTAVDKDYDFTQPDYNLKIPLPQGVTKMIQSGMSATGKFTFFCKKCGGPEQGPVGYIIVVPRK